MAIKKWVQVIFGFFLVNAMALNAAMAGELWSKVYRNDIEGVKKLLDAGADINDRPDPGGQTNPTALIMACSYYEDMAMLLIDRGADINATTDRGETALMAACFSLEKVARRLIEKGADVTARQSNGTGAFTGCIVGVLSGRVSYGLAELLLSKGADVDEASNSGDAAGYTPLMMAARNKKPELVKFLVKNGADVNAKAKDGVTPLSLAAKEKDAEMVRLLKKLGAKQ